MSSRKVVFELSKLWDAVAAKGKLTTENKVDGIKRWVVENPTVSSFQAAVNDKYDHLNKLYKDIIVRRKASNDNTAKTASKANVGHIQNIVSKYEEFMGINEVKNAHSRVLSFEAKFVECQEKRRIASKELSEIYKKLLEIRFELDRTERGDETYLDLIKQEIAATKEERIMCKLLEELERTEGEVFAELSSAHRINHEKERLQNEKTKCWSVFGLIFGTGFGILGTKIINFIKQIVKQDLNEMPAVQKWNSDHQVNDKPLTAEDAKTLVNVIIVLAAAVGCIIIKLST